MSSASIFSRRTAAFSTSAFFSDNKRKRAFRFDSVSAIGDPSAEIGAFAKISLARDSERKTALALAL